MPQLPLITPISIFGPEAYSFLDAVKHYNDIKVGYDGIISQFARASYSVFPLQGEQGTVKVRDQKSIQRMLSNLQDIAQPEAIAFKFAIPIPKRFQVKVVATLRSWDGEILASSETAGDFHEQENKRTNIVEIIGKTIEENRYEYGFMDIVLAEHNTRLTADNPEEYLQNKLIRCMKDTTKPTAMRRLFILNVHQFFWDSEQNIEKVITKFECREDSIILEIK